MSKYLTIILLLLSVNVFCQNTSFKTKKIKSSFVHYTKNEKASYNVSVISLEAPSPNGNSYKSFLMNQKIKSKKLFTKSKNINRNNFISETNVSVPEILNSYGMMYYNSSNDTLPIYGGLPNDNSMAISNDGLMLLAINSNIQLYDTKNDSLLYPNEFLSLRNIFNLSSGNYFDPKVIYDKDLDRFVLVFLKNNNPATNIILVGFSKTNNPIDGWNVYSLPGNPLLNNRWTDFPTIALSDNSLFFTGNLIIPGVSWQIGFDGSILWEMDKFAGFDSLDINSKLYYDIKFDEKYIRNLHSVQGANGNVANLKMLSNRNFDIKNDTFFIVSLVPSFDSSIVEVQEIISDISYGVPPNGRQFDTDTTDATQGLQTNDARVLGAIQFEDEIQFVSTTKNFETGFASIYHGTISSLFNNPILRSHLISDAIKDYAYPNIAWTGNEDCDRETMIAFNHTSFTDFAGISTIYCNNKQEYSDVLEIKKGESIVDRLSGGYERWGDYFGIQRKYNEAGKVYTFGFTTDETTKNFGWVNVLQSPDTNIIGFNYTIVNEDDYCTNKIEIEAFGGIPPYSVEWHKSNSNNNSLVSNNYCNGDTVSFTLIDSRNCNISDNLIIDVEKNIKPFLLFPNPTNDLLAFQFKANDSGFIKVEIFTAKGDLVKNIANLIVKKGLNELYFSTEPLIQGIYYVRISDNKNNILSEDKFLKK